MTSKRFYEVLDAIQTLEANIDEVIAPQEHGTYYALIIAFNLVKYRKYMQRVKVDAET